MYRVWSRYYSDGIWEPWAADIIAKPTLHGAKWRLAALKAGWDEAGVVMSFVVLPENERPDEPMTWNAMYDLSEWYEA